ncbi:hypothetical protein [Polynucleobacter kasalickyi]|uniref:Antitoxin Xre/MbcA/ParS-like toxin-binding domain-containing protein n=1 Tax=Polynucleobacter kasalickyi TaxID=1938817 RepID=A0A1W2AN49_9BURK|nr:hypothetical protein [Polynucleobacter kasalickyi]SMC62024.1 hypothetical protein SAMN06296008_10990 [Polynucleobacter kasalickyi]
MQTVATKIHPAIFNSIPQSDDLGLFKKSGKPDYDKVKDILGYTKQDISIASGIPIGSIRFDDKVPAELTERVLEWATVIALVHSFFNDQTKTMLWFKVPNPLLGDVAPRDMIKVGRYKKLLKFIQTALEEGR